MMRPAQSQRTSTSASFTTATSASSVSIDCPRVMVMEWNSKSALESVEDIKMFDASMRDGILKGLEMLKLQISNISECSVENLCKKDAVTILQICRHICCKCDELCKSGFDKKSVGVVLALLLTEIQEPIYGAYPDLLPDYSNDDDIRRYLGMCASKKCFKIEYIDLCHEQLIKRTLG